MAGVPIATPLIGRKAELSLIARALDGAKRGRGGVLIISGPTGAGKSRLLDVAADEASAEGFHILRGHAAEGDVIPYSAFRRALPGEDRGRGRDRASSRSREFGRHLAPGGGATPLGPAGLEPTIRAVGSRVGAGSEWGGVALGELLAPPEGREIKLEELPPLGAALRLLEEFAQLSEEAPLLLSLEAFHWADPGSLAILRPLAREARKRPLLIVLSFETDEVPSEEERSPVEGVARAIQRESGALRISLKGLTNAEVRELAEAMLQAPLLLDQEGELPPILARTGGNPFLVQEVLRAGLRDGWISRRGEGFRVLQPSHDLQVPALLRWWVHRRVAPLLPDDRALLEAISVLGSEFDPRALSTLLPEQSTGLKRGLERLDQRHGLVHQVRPGLWKVEPAFLLSVIRAEMAGELRRRLHRRAGEWHAAHDPSAIEQIASHYYQAGEPALALPWLERAWQAASDRSDNEAALRFARWGAELARAGNRPDEDIGWRVRESSALLILGEGQRARKLLEESMAVAPEGLPRVSLLSELARLELHQGRRERAFELLARAASEPVAPADAGMALVRVAAMRVDLNTRSQQWEAVAEEAPVLLEHADLMDERLRSRTLTAYGVALTAVNRFPEAREALLEALSRARKAGLASLESNARTSLGILAQNMGDLAVGRAMFEQSAEEWGRRGGLTNQAINTGNVAEAMWLQGDMAMARIWVEHATTLAEIGGLNHLKAQLQPLVARCYLEQGDLEKAEQVLSRMTGSASFEPGDDTYRELHSTWAQIHLARGRTEEAMKEAKLAGIGTEGLTAWLAARTYAQCLVASGDARGAEELLLSLIEKTQKLGRRMDLALCLDELGDLYQSLGRTSEARARWDEALGLLRASGALARAAHVDEKRRPAPGAPEATPSPSPAPERPLPSTSWEDPEAGSGEGPGRAPSEPPPPDFIW